MDRWFLIFIFLSGVSSQAPAQMVPFAFVRKISVSLVNCATGSPSMGDSCTGGGTYAGTFAYGGAIGTKNIMVTNGGCNNSATPTCSGTTDTYQPVWGTFNVTTGATDLNDGLANSILLASGSPDPAAVAAKFCRNMTYATFHDWYLPAQNELDILYTNMAAIKGFSTGGYWSSSEASAFSAFYQKFSDGTKPGNSKSLTVYVRCMRRY